MQRPTPRSTQPAFLSTSHYHMLKKNPKFTLHWPTLEYSFIWHKTSQKQVVRLRCSYSPSSPIEIKTTCKTAHYSAWAGLAEHSRAADNTSAQHIPKYVFISLILKSQVSGTKNHVCWLFSLCRTSTAVQSTPAVPTYLWLFKAEHQKMDFLAFGWVFLEKGVLHRAPFPFHIGALLLHRAAWNAPLPAGKCCCFHQAPSVAASQKSFASKAPGQGFLNAFKFDLKNSFLEFLEKPTFNSTSPKCFK